MIGIKLLWLGLTLLIAVNVWNPGGIPAVQDVGSVLMILGVLLFLFDK